MKKLILLILVIIISFANIFKASSKNWYVSCYYGDDTFTGNTDSDPFATIQKAIDLSASGDSVIIMPGVFEIAIPIDITASNKDIIVVAENSINKALSQTEIYLLDTITAIKIGNGNSPQIKGISFTGNYEFGTGNGIEINLGAPKISNCYFYNLDTAIVVKNGNTNVSFNIFDYCNIGYYIGFLGECTVLNNTFYGRGNSGYGIISHTSTINTIKNNIIEYFADPLFLTGTGVVTVTYNLVSNNYSRSFNFNMSNILDVDPLLDSYFKIMDGSPCIAAGEGGVDIGALPYKDCKAAFVILSKDTATNTITIENQSTLGLNYFWEFTDEGNFNDSKNERNITWDYKFPRAGYYNIYLSVNGDECYNTAYAYYELVGYEQNIIKANFYDEPINGLNIGFGLSDTINVNNCVWNFGDGAILNSLGNFSHTFPKEDFYKVCIVASNNTSNTYEYCRTIKVGDPLCNIAAEFKYIVDINKVIFINNTSITGNLEYYWEFGDGNTSLERDPGNHLYGKPGYYNVSLSVYDYDTQCSDYVSEEIKVGDLDCKAVFDYKPITGNNIQFNNKSKGASYYWDFGDGNTSELENPTNDYASPGIYYVSLCVSDVSYTCWDYSSQKIQVGEVDCMADFSYYVDKKTLTAYCKNESKGDTLEYYWWYGDGFSSIEKEPIHQFSHPGYYYIGLSVYNPLKDCMDYYEEYVLVGEQGDDCEADFIYQVSDETTREVMFSDYSLGNIVGYVWDFGDDSISNESNPTHVYSNDGYYNVCLTVTNDKDVTNITCNWIQVGSNEITNCNARIMKRVDSGLGFVSFKDISYGNPVEWKWDFGDGEFSSEQNPSHQYFSDGYYLVSLTIYNNAGFSDVTFDLVNIGMPTDQYAVDFGYIMRSIVTKASGYPVDFVGTGQGDHARLRWSFGDDTYNTTTNTPRHYYASPGEYEVCLTYEDPITEESETTCNTITVSGDAIKENSKENIFKCSPNPFVDNASITYYTNGAEHIRVVVCDLLGKMVQVIPDIEQSEGIHAIQWNTSGLAKGSYVVQLRNNLGVVSNKIVIKQ
jgi:PKD repeat protein